MTIIYDLDGTLIDSSERMYRLFIDLIPECEFDKDQYWKLKRDKVNHKMLLEKYFSQYDFAEFEKKWLGLIEKKEYLIMDKLYSDTLDFLDAQKGRHILQVLLTARQSKENLYEELERLGIKEYFDCILVTEGVISKGDLLSGALSSGIISKSDDDLFISDMGKDIEIGNDFGYKTVAISHGFMNRRRLQEYSPGYCVDNLMDIKFL